MKKSVIMGMVFVTAMSFTAHGAPGGKGIFERVAEGQVKIQESLYGTEKVKVDGKEVVRAVSLASLPEAVRRSKQDDLINKLSGVKATELRDYLNSSESKAVELARTSVLEKLLATKEYAESIKENAEAKEISDAADAMVILLSNTPRARDGKDASSHDLATLTLADQASNILQWSSAQRKNVSEIIKLQDQFMTDGMKSREALEKAYAKQKGVDIEVAKKAVDKIKELCKG
jgi:hypothetical protein